MTDAQIELAIRRALDGTIASHAPEYGLLLAFSLLIVVSTSFLAAYWSTRGKAFATKTDFDSVVAQLAKTTATAEKIKTAIQHQDWREKESTSIKRSKLEELLLTMIECNDWLIRQEQTWFSGDLFSELSRNPSYKLRVIKALYFPELDSRELEQAFLDQRNSINQGHQLIQAARPQGGDAMHAALQRHRESHAQSTARFTGAMQDMEHQAAALMSKLVNRPLVTESDTATNLMA